MAANESDKLAARFKVMESKGLVDVKFFLRNTDEATAEQVCAEVNRMLDAYEAGNTKPLDFKDSNRQQHPTA